MTPSKVPFWNGETYMQLLYLFIPRIIWPDKPVFTFWHDFGIAYGFLSTDDQTTSVGLSYLGEGYMNYGYPGMYTVALLFGVLVAFIERISFFYLRGNYIFCFMVFMLPILPFANAAQAILSSCVITCGVMYVLRRYFLRLGILEAYSK